MPLKFEGTHFGKQPQPVDSPLYGKGYVPPSPPKVDGPQIDLDVLHNKEVLDALREAGRIYYEEMVKVGYSPLTIGTYHSQVGRFILFLEQGQVLPDREQ